MTVLASSAVLTAFLIFCRVGACFMVIPGFSSARVPMQVRLVLVAAISLSLAPLFWGTSAVPGNMPVGQLAQAIGAELTIGASIGLVARLYVLAIGFIGTSIAMSIGLSGIAGAAIDEAEAQAPLANLISLSVLLILFIADFHHVVLRALAGSYDLLPVTQFPDVRVLLVNLTDTLTNGFTIALRLGSPFIAYAIIANLTVGILNKLTPQIPVYFVSLPFIICGGLALMYFSFPSLLSLAADGFLEIFGRGQP